MTPKPVYSSTEVVAMTGATARQLQWWDEHGYVKPIIESHRRFYTVDQVRAVGIFAQLRKRRISPKRIKSIIKAVEGYPGARYVIANADGFLRLICNEPNEAVRAMLRCQFPVWLLDLKEVWYPRKERKVS